MESELKNKVWELAMSLNAIGDLVDMDVVSEKISTNDLEALRLLKTQFTERYYKLSSGN